jgi:hypothetical protein
MIMRRSILGLVLLLSGTILLAGQAYASSVTGQDLSTVIGGDTHFPRALKPQLSSDGQSIYHGVAPVVYVADPNPPKVKLRVPPPRDLVELSQSATTNFSISYTAEGGTDEWGEYCYTFPEDAKAAFNAAASVWASLVKSSVPITIQACWASLSGSTLAYSGGGSVNRDFPNAARANTWYSASLANSLAGYDLDIDNADMHITYNQNFTWYFGTDGYTPMGQYDFMTVALHEICHGLNFSGSMTYSGGQGSWGTDGSANIYDTFMKDGSGNSLIDTGIYPNPSATLGSALTSNDIWFHGSNAMTANGGNPVKIYSPSQWDTGSSYSHLDYDTFSGTGNRLMVYAISSGVSIHDPGPVTGGLLRDLGWSGGPRGTTLILPSGTTTTNAPTYTWKAVSDSDSYYLWVDDATGNRIKQWYTAADAGCASGAGNCAVWSDTGLANGSAKWWVQTWNTYGYGPWSGPMNFTVAPVDLPGQATLISPSGNTPTNMPTFTWHAVSNSDQYYLWVNDATGNKIKQWYTAANSHCGAEACWVTPSTPLAFGSYKWWIRTYNASGLGLWSTPLEFSLGLATLSSPSGPITDTTPTYTWNAVNGSAWYHLYVSGPSGAAINQWYTSANANCNDTTCSVVSKELAFGNYKWWIQTYNAEGYGPWSAAKEFSLGAITLISPSGPITDTTPTYTWSTVPGSTWYYLYVSGPSGNAVINQWYTSANANCNETTCSVTPTTTLAFGTYKWWVQTYNSAGYGPWSTAADFSLGKVTLISPSGSIDIATPTYEWSSVPDATWYRLWLSGPCGNTVIDKWYTAAAANCPGGSGTCSVSPDATLAYDNYKWWIQTYNSAGYGPWSADKGFQVTNANSGFVWEFTGGVDGWVSRTGSWSMTSGSLTAPGLSDKFVTAYFQPALFSNFDYRARVWRSGCIACATSLLVRGDPSSLDSNDMWNSTYVFNISRDGYYAVFRIVGGSQTTLKGWTYSSAINQFDAWNEMQALMKCSDLWFGVNGVWLFNTTDSGLSSGYVGVGLYSPVSPTGDNIWVDRAQLTPVNISSVEGTTAMAISPEQLELNQAGDEEFSANTDYRMAPQ